MNTLKILVLLPLYCLPSILCAQMDSNDTEMKWMKGWTEFAPNQKEYPEAEESINNIITVDTYLKNNKVYLLSGDVYVTNGASLIIQEGTIIRGDVEDKGSLIITKGAQLIAQGTKIAPIVFTSNNPKKARKSGDWGGIIIAGNHKMNTPSGTGVMEGNHFPQYSTYGGGLEDDTVTNLMSYIRIEYAGKKINYSKEMNGLTLYALGKNSMINNIMVSYSGDDSYECFGGMLNMHHLISYKAQDDDFDFTKGYQGELNTIIAIRHPYITDASGSYAIEIDGYNAKDGFISPQSLTKVSIKNSNFINLTTRVNYKHTVAAIALNNWGKLKITDSKISGYANVVKLDASFKSFQDIKTAFSLDNNIVNVHAQNIITTAAIDKNTLNSIVKYNLYTNKFQNATEFFTAPMHKHNPIFTLRQEIFDSSTVMQ